MRKTIAVLALSLLATHVMAAVSPEEAAKRQHTPKVAFVAPATDYVSSSGKPVAAGDVDLLVRVDSPFFDPAFESLSGLSVDTDVQTPRADPKLAGARGVGIGQR